MSAAKSHKALLVGDWPAVDREAWEQACAEGDEISGWGAASRWARRSRENAEQAYGRFIGFLARTDHLGPVRDVGDRLVKDDLCAFGYELRAQLAPYTVLGIFASLNMAFSAMHPKADRALLNEIISRLAQIVTGVRDIDSNLLSPRVLIELGTCMMDDADTMTSSSFRRVSLYRDGLLIMFMALCPLRPGAVAEMLIDIHLLIEGDEVRIHLPRCDRKKRRLEDIPVPQELARRFVRYLTFYRPMLRVLPRPEQTQALWISRNGNTLDRDNLSKRVKERVGRRTGKRFTAHMFRHSAATFIVDVAPHQALMIIGVLGQTGFRTAQKHYIKGQQHMAVAKYQEAAKELIKRGHRQAKRKQRTSR